MREIKFRAWDKEERKMLDFSLKGMIDGSQELLVDFEGGVWKREKDKRLTPMNYKLILMQYTGLKDKNGKEIYEGDIVGFARNKFAGEILPLNPFKGFYIKWKKGCARIRYTEDGTEPIWGNHTISLEIIGNIYENPELLK